MRPTEIELLFSFRKALTQVYQNFNTVDKDRIFRGPEVVLEIKALIDYYDNLFKDAKTGK